MSLRNRRILALIVLLVAAVASIWVIDRRIADRVSRTEAQQASPVEVESSP